MHEPAISRRGHGAREPTTGPREHGPRDDVRSDGDAGDAIDILGLDAEPSGSDDARR